MSSTSAPARSLAEVVADAVLDQIVNGDFNPGDVLPREADLAWSHGVSRLTIREAIKGLAHLGVVEVRRGNGTFVCDANRWSPLEPKLLDARVRADGPRESVRLLLEARRAVERGAAELAARRRTASDLVAMRDALARMELASDKTPFAEADLAFHAALFVAARNPYLGALLQPVEELLSEHRVLTSSAAPARLHAIHAHRAVLAAVEARDVEGAGGAMVDHIDQTIADVMRYGLVDKEVR